MHARHAREAGTSLRVSVVIPVLNEQGHIGPLVRHLLAHADERLVDLVVVDGGSTDDTLQEAEAAGATVHRTSPGRAQQMNTGARQTSGDVLYFVHADTRPPGTFLDHIEAHLQKGIPMGCFRFRFDRSHPLLKVNAFFTRFDLPWCRGGDQSLYVVRELFEELGGFPEDYVIMEEYEFLKKARARADFAIMPDEVVVSARKYANNSYLRVNLVNAAIFFLYRRGVQPERLKALYARWLRPIPTTTPAS